MVRNMIPGNSFIFSFECGEDSFFIDGFHGSDAVYIKMFEDMIEQGSCLGKYCDTDQLAKLYENRDSNVAIYGSIEEY